VEEVVVVQAQPLRRLLEGAWRSGQCHPPVVDEQKRGDGLLEHGHAAVVKHADQPDAAADEVDVDGEDGPEPVTDPVRG
jgi:hypothetical protein